MTKFNNYEVNYIDFVESTQREKRREFVRENLIFEFNKNNNYVFFDAKFFTRRKNAFIHINDNEKNDDDFHERENNVDFHEKKNDDDVKVNDTINVDFDVENKR